MKSLDDIAFEEARVFIRDSIDDVCNLSKANRLTNIWDNRRFQECNKPVDQVDYTYLNKTEKLSRANVELRAVYRTQIDVLFDKILELRNAEREDRQGKPKE